MNKVRWLRINGMLAGIVFAGAALSLGYRMENAVIALVTKVVENVEKKKDVADWQKATKGDLLNPGDAVRTGEKSLAIIKFTTDNSILRVREQSYLTLNNEGSAKSVDLKSGGFGFDIHKQKENEGFRFTSPTAVASIRGTRGKLSGANGGDTLIVTEGLVNFRNIVSNKSLDVGAGTIGFSQPDGSLTSRKATPQELADASAAATGNTTNQLNIELKDGKGNTKKMKIEYKK